MISVNSFRGKSITEVFNLIKAIFSPNPENLFVGEDIFTLSKRVLTSEVISEVERLSQDISSGGAKKVNAINLLRSRIGRKPKRPLYYVTDLHLPHLPAQTRDIVRYLGDYIDLLVKCVVEENQRFIGRRVSLGQNIPKLKKIISEELAVQLNIYNTLIYTPAKHDFDVQDRSHRFSSKEVVFIIYMTLELAEKIKQISMRAKLYSEDKVHIDYL